MCSLIGWIILGAIAGWLASMVMGTNRQQGLIMDIIVGIIGGFIGGFVLEALNIRQDIPVSGVTGFNLISLVTAFVGAVILLFILRLIQRRG